MVNRDELAENLRAAFRASVVEADDWRPVADYILDLVKSQKQVFAEQVIEELRKLRPKFQSGDGITTEAHNRPEWYGVLESMEIVRAEVKK